MQTKIESIDNSKGSLASSHQHLRHVGACSSVIVASLTCFVFICCEMSKSIKINACVRPFLAIAANENELRNRIWPRRNRGFDLPGLVFLPGSHGGSHNAENSNT